MKGWLNKVSFAAGAIGKRLHARLDLARAQIAVAKAENMIVLLEGGLTRRPGTRFVLEHKVESEKAELIPFRYSGSDNYMIAVNGNAARFLRMGGFIESGGLPYELAVSWVEDDLPNLRWTQDGNIMHIACDSLQTRVLTRNDHANWTLGLYTTTNGPFETQNVDETKKLQASGVNGTITLTATGHAPFTTADVGQLWRLDESDLSTVASWRANETALSAGDQRRWDGNVYEVVSGADSGPNAPVHTEGDVLSSFGKVLWRYRHSGYGIVKVTIFTTAALVTGEVQVRLPESVVSAASYRFWPPAWSDARGWPKIVYRYQRRLTFLRDAYFWFANTTDSNDHGAGPDPDDAFSGLLRSQEGSLVTLEWLVGSGILVAGARDGEYALRAPNVVDALTIENIRPIPETSEGSAPHVPAPVDGGALFIGRSRDRLHFAKFDRTAEEVTTTEVSVSNRDLFKSLATHLAFARDPDRVCWIGCQNGKLLGMTWMPEQQVVGLHAHPLRNGYVESVRAIASSDEGKSEVYMSVRRTIGGVTRRYYEQLMDTFEPLDADAPTAEGAWFLDCAIRYQGVAATIISGLDHLEGEEVGVFVDGAEHPRRTVSGGAITLQWSGTDVLVGLPITYRIRSLPMEWPKQEGSSTEYMLKVGNHVLVRVLESYGGQISVNDGELEDLSPSGAAAYSGAVPLVTGKLKPTTSSPHDRDLVWEISGDHPYPFTLLGCGPEADAEEGS